MVSLIRGFSAPPCTMSVGIYLATAQSLACYSEIARSLVRRIEAQSLPARSRVGAFEWPHPGYPPKR